LEELVNYAATPKISLMKEIRPTDIYKAVVTNGKVFVTCDRYPSSPLVSRKLTWWFICLELPTKSISKEIKAIALMQFLT
jgi:hypothetical protein